MFKFTKFMIFLLCLRYKYSSCFLEQDLPEDHINDLESIRKANNVYIDKTQLALKLIEDSSNYYFMCRPRKFGKTLFLDTLKNIFEGRKDLFNGTYILKSNYNWIVYPVLRFSFLSNASSFEENLKNQINLLMDYHNVERVHCSDQMKCLIQRLSARGQKVVVLVDEYDFPIVHNQGDGQAAMKIVTEFLLTLKDELSNLRFIFVTGTHSFSLGTSSIFDFMRDITLNTDFVRTMGLTQGEMRYRLKRPLEMVADQKNTSVKNILAELCRWYDGYCFSKNLRDKMYNPMSIKKYLERGGQAEPYWYQNGSTQLILRKLQKEWIYLNNLNGTRVSGSELGRFKDVDSMEPRGMMFNMGYLTVTTYNASTDEYTLDYPNKEVSDQFEKELKELSGDIEMFWVRRSVAKIREYLLTFQYSKFLKFVNYYFVSLGENEPGDKEWYRHHMVQFLKVCEPNVTDKYLQNTDNFEIELRMESGIIYIFDVRLGTSNADIKEIQEKMYREKEFIEVTYNFIVRMCLVFATGTNTKNKFICEYSHIRWNKNYTVVEGPTYTTIFHN